MGEASVCDGISTTSAAPYSAGMSPTAPRNPDAIAETGALDRSADAAVVGLRRYAPGEQQDETLGQRPRGLEMPQRLHHQILVLLLGDPRRHQRHEILGTHAVRRARGGLRARPSRGGSVPDRRRSRSPRRAPARTPSLPTSSCSMLRECAMIDIAESGQPALEPAVSPAHVVQVDGRHDAGPRPDERRRDPTPQVGVVHVRVNDSAAARSAPTRRAKAGGYAQTRDPSR